MYCDGQALTALENEFHTSSSREWTARANQLEKETTARVEVHRPFDFVLVHARF